MSAGGLINWRERAEYLQRQVEVLTLKIDQSPAATQALVTFAGAVQALAVKDISNEDLGYQVRALRAKLKADVPRVDAGDKKAQAAQHPLDRCPLTYEVVHLCRCTRCSPGKKE